MSVQFGRWNIDGKPVDQDYIEKVKPVITPYGPDDGASYTKTGISILYRAFHNEGIPPRSTAPRHGIRCGHHMGRSLDNRAELIRQLRNVLTISSTDVSIVVAAYEEWGIDCFAKLVGDWALHLGRQVTPCCSQRSHRHTPSLLFHRQQPRHLSTIPDHSFSRRQVFRPCEEYIAGWFSFFPPLI
jgi:hypothetical protein